MPTSNLLPFFPTETCLLKESSDSALTAGHFLLLRQKKVTKEKAIPAAAVGFADCPARLAKPGGCATRACSPQTVLADFPQLACVARHGKREKTQTNPARQGAEIMPNRYLL
jgi:hypothetical protein